MTEFSFPSAELLQKQAEWLAPFRARLLRRVQVAQRRSILDLGCGSGAVTAELVRRSRGRMTAVDRNIQALGLGGARFQGTFRVCADASELPFASESFDLVFCQWVLLWTPLRPTIEEIWRVLRPGGVLVALEPDYGGMIEYPPEIASGPLWQAALRRVGADPEVGRKLPPLCAEYGFEVEVMLLDRLVPPDPVRFALLRELPLQPEETVRLEQIVRAESGAPLRTVTVHLPIFGVLALRR